MTYVVVLTDQVQSEMEAAYLWWAEHRSEMQAAEWYNPFADAITASFSR
jgi:hypothetical protein